MILHDAAQGHGVAVLDPHGQMVQRLLGLMPKSLEVGEYCLADLLPEGNSAEASYTAQDVWDTIVTHAHATGEPGLCFIDRVNEDNPTPCLG